MSTETRVRPPAIDVIPQERRSMPDLLAFYRQLVAADPASASLRAQLAQALLAAGDAWAALTEAEAACAADPACLPAWLARASACQSLRDFATAAASLERAVALAPAQSVIVAALGNAYAERGRLEEAAAMLRRAVDLDPLNTAALANLGGIHLRLGNAAAAIDVCRAALAREPDLVSAHQNLATLLAETDPRTARFHRDSAYGYYPFLIEPALRSRLVALVPTAAGQGNVPLDHLLPRTHVTLIRWYIEYARADQLGDLPRHDIIFNAIGDADFAPALDPAVRRWLRDQGALNDPDRVAATRRNELAGLLHGLGGVVVPDAIRLAAGDAAAREAMIARDHPRLPVLVRPVGAHGGEGVRLVHTAAQCRAALAGEAEHYVTAFVDSRGADGMYRKYRAIFVDGVAYPYHLAITPDWLVHYWTAGMEEHPAHRREEALFLADPAESIGARAWAAIAAIGARLGLDYAGIDFSVLPGGDVLVFEANATMLVHPEEDPVFLYKNAAVERILAAFAAMASRAARRLAEPAAA